MLPEVDTEFRELDSRMRLRLEQRKHLSDRLHGMLTAPRPEYLATAEEQLINERLERIEQQLGDGDDTGTAALRDRVKRLRGMLTWRLDTEYQERLTAAYAHLAELDVQVDALNRQYEAFVRARQAATHSYIGYDETIETLRRRVSDALQRVETLMTRQGDLIEKVAIHQLESRRERLVTQQTQARYAVADSYDRAARAQNVVEEP